MGNLRILCVVLAGVAIAPMGCHGDRQVGSAAEPLRLHNADYANVMQAAEAALSGMRFAIEKLDAGQGIIRTEPLRGAQFFELWRSDNVGLLSAAEANLHTIRRTVEVRIREQADQGVQVDCDVWVQRLSLPENEVASVSQAYRMHSRSTAVLQTLELDPRQRLAMTWIDLGKDRGLEARILERIEQRLAELRITRANGKS